jgi:hypothetical protein
VTPAATFGSRHFFDHCNIEIFAGGGAFGGHATVEPLHARANSIIGF